MHPDSTAGRHSGQETATGANAMEPLACANLDDDTRSLDQGWGRVVKLRQRLISHLWKRRAMHFWKSRSLLDFDGLHARISTSIRDREAFAIGRIGGVEANIIFWARGMPSSFPDSLTRPYFSQTAAGSTNAGIRPRNRESYRLFAGLAYRAFETLDLCGVWCTHYEPFIMSGFPSFRMFDSETIAPSINGRGHWMRALDGKRVLVVSPFETTIRRQIPRLADVWSHAEWKPDIDFRVLRFPYLIDEGCPETWWDVHNRIGAIVADGGYDVALFGCGGLGLPFAAIAKQAGKVGIQLGGHLQLLFGIYGSRHLQQDWHRISMNPHWVPPDPSEIPQSASRVENRCYW